MGAVTRPNTQAQHESDFTAHRSRPTCVAHANPFCVVPGAGMVRGQRKFRSCAPGMDLVVYVRACVREAHHMTSQVQLGWHLTMTPVPPFEGSDRPFSARRSSACSVSFTVMPTRATQSRPTSRSYSGASALASELATHVGLGRGARRPQHTSERSHARKHTPSASPYMRIHKTSRTDVETDTDIRPLSAYYRLPLQIPRQKQTISNDVFDTSSQKNQTIEGVSRRNLYRSFPTAVAQGHGAHAGGPLWRQPARIVGCAAVGTP
jgi:hypothetical protein